MALTVDATYENGVFVPTERPALAEHERVRLVVESIVKPHSVVNTMSNRRDRRISLDPRLAQDIASSPDFHPNGN